MFKLLNLDFCSSQEVVCVGACGSFIGDKYCLIEKIGQGGFGEVYLAVDERLGRRWAVKVLPGSKPEDMKEAALMKGLNYPTIPAVVDLYERPEGCYLVMDFLQGKTLAQMLSEGYTFTEAEIWRIGIALAGTMEYLHGCTPAIFYRDLKPDNIMITEDGQIKLIDFGIASYEFEQERQRESFAGTEAYAAPEQFGGTCDERTDIYGIGMTLRALCRDKKFRKVRKVCDRCCRKSKTKRFQHASLLRERMELYAEEEKQSNRYKRGIAVVVGILILAGITQGLTESARELRYHGLLVETEKFSGKELDEDEALKREGVTYMDLCEQAIHLRPKREEGYLRLLAVGEDSQNTREAIERIASLRKIYEDETRNHTAIPGRVGYLYFAGNAEDESFTTDYALASLWFSKADFPGDRESQMAKLSDTLCMFSNEIDWKDVAENLQQLEMEAVSSGRIWEETYPGLLACGGIWIADAAYLEAYVENPYQKGITLYEQLLSLAEQQDPIYHQEEKRELLERLSSALVIQGMMQTETKLQEDDLEKAVEYGERLLKTQVVKSLRERIMLRIASCYHLLGRETQCVQYYEQAVQEFGDQIETLCVYAGYLMEQENWTRAEEILQQAGNCEDAEDNMNYQILKERLEEIL